MAGRSTRHTVKRSWGSRDTVMSVSGTAGINIMAATVASTCGGWFMVDRAVVGGLGCGGGLVGCA